MPYLDRDKILNSLTKEDVIKICLKLGSESYREDNNALVFQTICHNATGGSYKLYYYHEANGNYPGKIFHCYSGCSDTFNIIELVIRANKTKGVSLKYYEALKYIADTLNRQFNSESSTNSVKKIDDFTAFINKAVNKSLEIPTLKAYNENILKLFKYDFYYPQWLDEHITEETMREFEIGFDVHRNVITIPHRDMNNRLVGIRGRYILDEDVEKGKYRPIFVENFMAVHSLGSNMYGISAFLRGHVSNETVILFESEKSVLQAVSYGYRNVLAVCGSNITPIQKLLLLKVIGAKEIVIAFDKEFSQNETYEEEIYRNKIYKKIYDLTKECKVSLMWDKTGLLNLKDSPTDCGKEVFEYMYNNRIEITPQDIQQAFDEERIKNNIWQPKQQARTLRF